MSDLNTVLFINGDGSIADGSVYGRAVTGNAQVSTSVKKHGSGSVAFDGSGDKLTVESSADFAFGIGDYTIELWVMRGAGGQAYARATHFGPYWASDNAHGIVVSDPDAGGKLTYVSSKLGAARLLVSSTTLNQGVWYHVAVTRASGVFRLFLDGVLQATNSSYVGASIDVSSSNWLTVGSAEPASGSEDFSGYIDDLRVTKNLARYTGDFTPPAPSITASASIQIPPLAMVVGLSGATLIERQLPPSVMVAANSGAVGGGMQLPALAAGIQTAEHLPWTWLVANLPAVTAQGSSGATCFANFPLVTAQGSSGASCSAALPAVTAFGQGSAGGVFGKANLPPLRVFALGSPSVLNALSASLPPVHAIGQGGAVAKMGIPPFRIVEASATVSGVGRMVVGRLPPIQITASALVGSVGRAEGWLPGLVAHGVGAAVGRATLPTIAIGASATVGVVGRMGGGRLPPIQATASALVGAVGRAAGVVLPSTMGGTMVSGGGTLSPLVFPAFAGGGTGTMGAVGRMVGGVIPAIAGYGSARHENYGRMVGGRLPSLIMPKQVIGRATLPPLAVRAAASAGVGHAWTLEWAMLAIEAYVMGVDATGEATAHPVTRYTNYPFLQIIRLGDSYYGVAPNGLHRIGGTQDDNGVPIPWAMQTHVTDFGSQFHKTVASAYIGGTIGPLVTFSVLTGEHPEQMHAHTNTFTTQLKNHREKFGKGRKARYWAFGLSSSSTSTSSLMLDALDLEVFEMSRRVI